MTLVAGVGIAVAHSMTAALGISVLLANYLIWMYLLGPARSVAVGGDTLRINNVIRSYVIPRSSVLSIDHFDYVGIRARIMGERPIWVDAFSRGNTNQWRRPYGQALEAQAKELSDALFTTPAPDHFRKPEKAYRWLNIIALGFSAISVGLAVAMLVE